MSKLLSYIAIILLFVSVAMLDSNTIIPYIVAVVCATYLGIYGFVTRRENI